MYITLFAESYPTAYVELQLLNSPTIRHNKCDLVILDDIRCSACKGQHKALHAIYTRISKRGAEKENQTSPSSHVKYCHLTTPEKKERISRLHDTARVAKQRIGRLEARLKKEIDDMGDVIVKDTHQELHSIMSDHESLVHQSFPPDSFGRLFWDQQSKALQAKTASAMRWHPLMIKWCLYLRHLSGGGYEALRKSSCISLPSQRTLRDYTHVTKATSGFS